MLKVEAESSFEMLETFSTITQHQNLEQENNL
jgi:hypothetical protein